MGNVYAVLMNGHGTRTADFGAFKPLIQINNRTILEYLLHGLIISGLDVENDTVHFIVNKALPITSNIKQQGSCTELYCAHLFIIRVG